MTDEKPTGDRGLIPGSVRYSEPYATCGRCGRETRDPGMFGAEDRAVRADGFPCGGSFSDPRPTVPTGDSRDEWIALLKSGTCPICLAGNFRVVMTHINRAHGLKRRDLNDALRIPESMSICSKEVSELRSEQARRNEYWKLAANALTPETYRRGSETQRRRSHDKPPGTGRKKITGMRLPVPGARHGTMNGYQSDGCRCGFCLEARRAHRKSLRGTEPPHHGRTGYQVYGCRCDTCRSAWLNPKHLDT